MNASNIAFLNDSSRYHVREERGSYDPEIDADDAAADHAKHLYKAQRQVGEALNLAGLLLASLEDEGDRRAMQIHTAAHVIENKLEKAYRQIDRHDARHTKLFLAYAELRDEAEDRI